MYPTAFSSKEQALCRGTCYTFLVLTFRFSSALVCSHRFVCVLFYHAVLIWEHFTEHKVYARLYVSSIQCNLCSVPCCQIPSCCLIPCFLARWATRYGEEQVTSEATLDVVCESKCIGANSGTLFFRFSGFVTGQLQEKIQRICNNFSAICQHEVLQLQLCCLVNLTFIEFGESSILS